VQFISALLHEPDLIVLDEPFAGLDPVNTGVLKDTVLDLRRGGKTIVFSTHIMEHAEKLCDQLCIIARGRKLIEGSVAEVKQKHGGRHVTVAFDGATGDAKRLFADGRLVRGVQDFGQYAELEMAEGADPQEILRALLGAGARLTHFEVASPSLHKIFVDVVGPEAAVAAATPGEVARA
jgi:ABC-2 type transport system ATP-binding protein